MPQSLARARALVTAGEVKGWMEHAEVILKLEAPDALQDPKRMFNGDEFGVPLNQKAKSVLAATGQRQVYQRCADTREQITVYACGNAAGDFVSPRILFPGERLRNVGIGEFPEAEYSATEKGWMNAETFIECLVSLNDFILEKSIPKPVILFIDGHKTHCTLEAAKFCAENNIVLYCLLPHASHLTQPLDVGVFSSMQRSLREEILEFQRRNPNEMPTKYVFPKILRQVWEMDVKSANLREGFKAAGLFPFNGNILHDRIVAREQSVEDLATGNFHVPDSPTQDATVYIPPIPPVEAPSTSSDPLPTFVVPTHPPISLAAAPDVHVIQSTSNSSAASARRYHAATPTRPQALPPTIPSTSSPDPSTSTTPTSTFTPSSVQTTSYLKRKISPAFEDGLKIPDVKPKKMHKALLPNHLSGARFIAHLEAKREEKEMLEREKEERRLKREQRKKEKEEEEIAKQKQKEDREKKRAEKAKNQKEKTQRKTGKKHGKRVQNKTQKSDKKKKVSESSDSEEEGLWEADILYDDSSNYELNENVDATKCPKCGDGDLLESSDPLDIMVGCEECPRWWHLKCTGDPDIEDYVDDLENFPFTCLYCEC